jgi:hypothetical protein
MKEGARDWTRKTGVDSIPQPLGGESVIPRWYFLGPRRRGLVAPTREEQIEMQMMVKTQICRGPGGRDCGPEFYMTEEEATVFVDRANTEERDVKPTKRMPSRERTEADEPMYPDVKIRKTHAA